MTESAQEGQPVDYLKMAQERAAIIKMLVSRRHPFAGHQLASEEENGRAEAYIIELQAMNHQDLLRLQAEQKERERLRALSELERREEKQFYSQPAAQANFVLWAQRAMWGIGEGVALLLGKSPDVVTPDRMQTVDPKLPFSIEYNELYKIALSHSYSGGQLSPRTYPHVFLRWAERYDKQIPAELLAAVAKYSGNLVDWQDVCDTYKRELESERREANVQRKDAESWREAWGRLKKMCDDAIEQLTRANGVIYSQRLRIEALEQKVESEHSIAPETEAGAAKPSPEKVSKRMQPNGGDALTPVVWNICHDLYEEGSIRITPLPVMSRLQKMAKSESVAERDCLVCATEAGVKWTTMDGEEKELTSNLLAGRINGWKTATGLMAEEENGREGS